MSERDVIARTPSPRTCRSLAGDLRRLGVAPGMAVIVHSSLSSLGWVCGGPVAVVQALMDVVTDSGTLVMATHSNGFSDPAHWENPPVPQSWWEAIRETMPVYDPQTTPTSGMGSVVEVFRTWPGVKRSGHPHFSFAAWGKHAGRIVEDHGLDHSLGEGSPLARVYDLDGWVLLLGVGYESNTSFHLAEYRAPGARRTEVEAPILEDGRRVWRKYEDIEMHEEVFPKLGAAFEKTGDVRVAEVGSARARLFSQRDAVDFAQGWLTRRRAELSTPPTV